MNPTKPAIGTATKRTIAHTSLKVSIATPVLMVAVGTPVTQRPPHRSRRAALPHRAPASGRDAQALRGIRMKDMGFGEPLLCDGVHAWPCHPVALTASAQRLTPIPHDCVAEYPEQAAIARDGIVSIMPQQHAF